MNISEIRTMQVSGLRQRLLELKRELMNIRFRTKIAADAALSGKIHKIKKDVARVMTVMREQGFKH